MGLETLMLSEVSQKRKRQTSYDITYIWNLIYSTNKPSHRKETHGLGEQTCGCQQGWGGSGVDWELGVNRYKLLPLEWISNEILLCSTGNYVQSLMLEHDCEIECVHECVTVTMLYRRQKLYCTSNY